ncbi:MAG: HupE/UreJ family protein [Deltaproteobacteria bacterium]|nr:HupE/UreJ family protein [Deltaproteobacteria bacterium]
MTPTGANAHNNTTATLRVSSSAGFLEVELRGSRRTFAPLLGDLEKTPPVARYHAQRHDLEKQVAAHLSIYNGDKRFCHLHETLSHVDMGEFKVLYRYRCPVGELELRYDLLFSTDPDHRVFATFMGGPEAAPLTTVLDRKQRTLRLDGGQAGLQASSFFGLGVGHILGGADHILFLMGLLLVIPLARSGNKRHPLVSLLQIITTFTLAHSVTLGATALGWIDLPSRAVEATIAVSICYIAVENLLWAQSPLRLPLVGIFGLVHGLGFAHILAETPLPSEGKVLALASFNLGVEAGQLALVLALLPLGWFFSRWKSYPTLFLVANGLLFIMGALWLVQRLFAA